MLDVAESGSSSAGELVEVEGGEVGQGGALEVGPGLPPARRVRAAVPGTDTDKIGSVTRNRFDEIVSELRAEMREDHRIQFVVGDRALEVEPMRQRGGSMPNGDDDLFTVAESLHLLAEETGIPYSTIERHRWTASRFPAEHRNPDVSHSIHGILASISDDEERFEALDNPPPDKHGRRRWTPDVAKRRVGQQVTKPETPQEKVRAIHRLARDEEVAAQVTTDFLRRPAVASQVTAQDKVRVVEEFTRDDDVATEVTTNILRRPTVAKRAMADDTTRFLVNEAQHHNDEEARAAFHRDSPVAPTVRRLQHSIEFIELVGAFHALVTAAARIVPRLRDRHLSDDERAVIHENVSRVKATLEWVEHAVDTGKVDMDTELERLIRGE